MRKSPIFSLKNDVRIVMDSRYIDGPALAAERAGWPYIPSPQSLAGMMLRAVQISLEMGVAQRGGDLAHTGVRTGAQMQFISIVEGLRAQRNTLMEQIKRFKIGERQEAWKSMGLHGDFNATVDRAEMGVRPTGLTAMTVLAGSSITIMQSVGGEYWVTVNLKGHPSIIGNADPHLTCAPLIATAPKKVRDLFPELIASKE